MTVIDSMENYYDEDRNRPDRMVYDLNEEKKMIAEATEEIKKELWEKWQRRYANAQIFPSILENVNPNLTDFLLSFESTLFYNDLAKKFNLNQTQRDALSQAVWEISLSRNWEAGNNLFSGKLNLDPSVSGQLIQLVNQNILFKARELSESKFVPGSRTVSGGKKEVQKMEISLLQAIQAYPNLGEQLITSGMIRLKIFPQPVRPSIKNWIEDYRSVMGAERHGMMERGNYLFHTENTKRLASGERKKLAEVLRSLDEDVTLSIDPDRQEIIFNQVEEMKPVEKMSNSQFLPPQRDSAKAVANKIQDTRYPAEPGPRQGGGQIPDASMHFSSPHILPSEKNDKPSSYQAVSPSESSDLPKRQIFNSPSFDSRAGKPWEPASASQRRGEPRVSGNTVDLRN